MTIDEFRAFIKGIDVQGTPTERQWKRIVKEIEDLSDVLVTSPYMPITFPIYPPNYEPAPTRTLPWTGDRPSYYPPLTTCQSSHWAN